MELLIFFENIRNPIFNFLFNLFTFFTEELFVIALVCYFAWCYDKKLAHQIGLVFSFSMAVNQLLKITFCIPRPWVRYNITPYEGALETATGYSFPSGHTQTAATIFPAIAYYLRCNWLYVLTIAYAIIVGISRMYYGVHTLWDVVFGLAAGLFCAFVMGRFFQKMSRNPLTILLFGVAFSFSFVAFALIKPYPIDADVTLVDDCFKQAGLMLGFYISLFLENKFLNYSVKSPAKIQVIKYVFGILILIIIKLMFGLFKESYALYIVEYFTLIFWCVFLYPLLFTKIIKRGNV